MADSFFHRLSQKLGMGKARVPSPHEIAVIVFGKHPAWNDHIPELGPEPDRLVHFKQELYEGITGNVDNGQWEKLQKEGQLRPWGHNFLLTGGGEPVAARCWYSRDGKGRDRYPMIAAALCGGMPPEWVSREAFEILRSLQTRCEAATSADAVQAASQDSAAQLRGRLSNLAASNGNALARLASRPEFDPHRTGLLRVIYHLSRDYPAGGKGSASRNAAPRPVAVRVPPCDESAAAALGLWSRFFGLRLGEAVEVLCIVPDDVQWLDALVGPTDVSELFCLRAPLPVIPFTSEIPYSLDSRFVEQVGNWIDGQLTPGSASTTP